MYLEQVNNLRIYKFSHFSACKNLVHGVFARQGGVSVPPFDSLNFKVCAGDSQEHVEVNRKRACAALGISELQFLDQCHSDIVVSAPASNAVLGDALITNVVGQGLMIAHADCQAAIFYDPIKQALGVAHSGWRGSVQNIYAKTIEEMRRCYGCRPENILVGISPSLGPKHAEFKNYQIELPLSFWKFKIAENHFDFWQISEMQLRKAGILESHIEVARICTYENNSDFFSYRRDKVTGRNATIAAL